MKFFRKIIFAIIFAISIILISCAPDSPTPTSDTSTPTSIFSMRSTDPLVFKDKLWVLGGSSVDGSCNGAKDNTCYDVWSSSNGKDWSLEATSGLNFLEKEVRSNFYSIVFGKKIIIFDLSSTTEIWTSENGKDWNQITTDLNFNILLKPLVVGKKIIARSSSRFHKTTNLENWTEIIIDPQSRGLFKDLYYHDQTYFMYRVSYGVDASGYSVLLGHDIYTSRDLSSWTTSDFFSFTEDSQRSFDLKIINLGSESYLFSSAGDIYTNDNPTTGNWRKLTQDRDFSFARNIVYFKEKFFAVIIGFNFNTENEVWSWSGDENQAWQKIR